MRRSVFSASGLARPKIDGHGIDQSMHSAAVRQGGRAWRRESLRRAPHNAYAWPPWIVRYNVPHGFVIKSLLPSASAAFGNTNRWTLQEANDPKVGW